jgi:PAS domain S-box-containing protein
MHNSTEKKSVAPDEQEPRFRIDYSEYLANTMQYLDAIVFSSTPDGKKYFFITDTIERIVGITVAQALADPFAVMRMVVKDDFHQFRELAHAVREKRNASAEYRIINKRNETVFIRHSIYPIMTYGEVSRVDGIIFDITREKLNEIKLRKSEEKLRNLIETAEDLIFILDKNGNFVSVNNAGALNLEYLGNEMLHRHFLEFVEDEKKAGILKSFQEILRSKQVITFESFFKTKYGKSAVFEVNARAIYENEQIDGVIGIGRNITARRIDQEKVKELNTSLIEANRIISIERDRAKQKISNLEELNRMKNEFVSNVSHELRTPLASIIGFAETIDSDRSMPEEMKHEFNLIILDEAKRLSKLINDVLDISKVEEGNIALAKSEFNLLEMIAPLLAQYKIKAEQKGLDMRYEIPDSPVIITADRSRLLQVFDDILANAVKFTGVGRITVLMQMLYREFEIIITDTGIGIPKKDLAHVFEKFFRVERPGEQIPGTGLGLALVKQIVDLHKGFVTVQSEENKGTTVLVRLPIVKQE